MRCCGGVGKQNQNDRKNISSHGRILLVEEDYTYPSESINNEELIFKATQPYSRYSYIKDAVDEVIEKILDKDGDVEFVNKRMVEKHGNIALLL